MRATRIRATRNLFHAHSSEKIRRRDRARFMQGRVPLTLLDRPMGIPFNNSYLIRLNEHFTTEKANKRAAVLEREDYDTPSATKYSFRQLGTDMHHRKSSLVDEHEDFYMSDNTRVGRSVGLIADRNYEFVGGLFDTSELSTIWILGSWPIGSLKQPIRSALMLCINLLSLFATGLRPVLIANNSQPREIAELMQTAETSHLITPRNMFETPLMQEFRRQNQQYHISAITKLSHETLLSITQMKGEYHTKIDKKSQGTILFTSGTTGKPKAVFTDMSSVSGQCGRLRRAWEYTTRDHILHTLPNHHIHGLVNVLLTPLYSGSSVEFTNQPFNAVKVLERIAQPASHAFPQVTMFHGVPTMYASFITAYDSMPPSKQEEIAAGLKNLRVAVCGSAALPTPIAEKWKKITGSIPLERYGMTETGMVFTNPLEPEKRIPGSVGYPFLNIHTQLLDPNGIVIPRNGIPGDLVIKWQDDADMFGGYWGNWNATAEARVNPIRVIPEWVKRIEDGTVILKNPRRGMNPESRTVDLGTGWFATGDVAMRGEQGEMIMLGRKSVDIMKVGGNIVSALEVERELLGLDEPDEVAVVGLPSEKFGKIPAAIVKLKPEYAARYNGDPEYKREFVPNIRKKARELLSAEKLPRKWIIVDKIPRNAMGKVMKAMLLKDKALFPNLGMEEPISDPEEITDLPKS
ncbi:hypothetical protein H072_1903 [Dactylellina haptotyla CBS 200.50]|uniref:AMP-dependent synthetase/ligase domain-containing protein n=1 Tax=Dactylellina haptotyla (strain CBS 200.50) TaxID=1284197 RepID=S8BX74_DACHA|nr:hypothetical protein H072_1903 [Dactylellina haptotyla CBS 200.50]